MTDQPTDILKQAQPEQPPMVVKPSKKKGGKGWLIGLLLFFILTIPVAIYYVSQQNTQVTETRSKATAPAIRTCYSTLVSCQNSQNACQVGTGTKMYVCNTDTKSCSLTSGSYGSVTDCQTNVRQYTTFPNTDTCYTTLESCQGACQGIVVTPTTPVIIPTSPPSCRADGQSCSSNSDCCNQNCSVNGGAGSVSFSGIGLTEGTGTGICGSTTTPTNTPGPTSTPLPTSTPTVSNTAAPGQCDSSCNTDSNCASGLYCYLVTGVQRCRKDACPDRSDCTCPLAETTPVYVYRTYTPPGQPAQVVRVVTQPTQGAGERVIAQAPTATITQQPTPKVPVSGAFDVKAIVITVGSILLLALGLIL